MYRVYCDDNLIYDVAYEDLRILNAKISLELNKTGSFTFTIYPNHAHYGDLQKLKSIITVYQDDYLLFRGRILNDEQGFYNEKQVVCEGELAFLVDSIQRPYDFMSGDNHTTITDLFTYFINNHNSQVDEDKRFIVGDITVTDPNNYIVRADSTYLNTWDSINKKLIETNGGYVFVRHESDGNYIDYVTDFNLLSSQKIEFGENLLDINKIIKGEELATAIIPLGVKNPESEERLTIRTVNEGVDYVYNQDAVDTYGWIFKTATWDDVTTASALKTKGEALLANSINLIASIELTAADLSGSNTDVSAFHFGTYVEVISKPHNLDSNFLVTKLSIDLLNPASNKLTLGASYMTFTEQTSNVSKNTVQLTEKVTGIESQTIEIKAELTEQLVSSIDQSATEILTQVSQDYYLKSDANTLVQSINTQFSQTNDEFEFKFNEIYNDVQDVQSGSDTKFQEINKYIRFIDGDIILGESDNQLTLKIQNDRISFLENNVEVAYFSNRKLYINDAEILSSLQLGNFAFIPRQNGNLSFKKNV